MMDPVYSSANTQEDNRFLHRPSTISSSPVRARRASIGGAPPKIRRRNRLITSCLECRRRKLKCDKSHPCTNCTKFVRDCVFLAPALDPAAQLKLAEIKEKMGSLERTLEDDIARRGRADSSVSASGGISLAFGESSEEEPTGPEDEKDLEPTPLAISDAAYYEDADDDFMDLGVQIGKMRLTDRIGGFVRPKFSHEINYVLKERSNFKEGNLKEHESDGKLVQIKSEHDGLEPSKDFMTPSSSFFFAPEPQRSSFMIYLPSKNVADSLLNQYWVAVHPMCRVVHRPSFERQWVLFWQQVQSGLEPPASMQALAMGAMLSAVISLSDHDVMMQLGVPKQQLLQSFQQGAESALYRANFLRTSKLQTIQAMVMYLIPLCRREVTRAHSALTGTAIRLAECMGLHRDGTHYGLSPVEVHVRRMVWYQLCFLDIRTCEATGPRPQIRREDFDTSLPLNVNDVDLESKNPPTEDSSLWTDMTFSRIRFEVNEMHRFTWMERPRLERKKTTLTAVLLKVQNFIAVMDKKFLPMLDKSRPVARMALLVYKMMTLRLHIMLLHRYAGNHARAMPERLRKILLTSGVQQVECAMAIETDPALQTWSWYLGALHQYHTALLLLSELYATDVRYHEDRIWNILDFVFENPPDLTRRDKARLILSEVAQKTEVYHSLRRVRTPQVIEKAMAQTQQDNEVNQMRQYLQHQVSTASGQVNGPRPNAGRVPPQVEYRTFHPNITDQVYYAPKNTNMCAATAQPALISPPGSDSTGDMQRGRGESFGSGGSPGEAMVDVDWNEWDKMFPPDTNLSDFGNIPDFQFSTHIPNAI